MVEQFLTGKVMLYSGDCLALLPTLAENSFDSCVTDPPYALESIRKRFADTSIDGDTDAETRARERSDSMGRLTRGFMGMRWDVADVAHSAECWREVYRVLKPGAFVLAFGGTRTYHRLACAIEDAGFEVRDIVQWLYGSGFPKSHDVSKGIDKAAGVLGQRGARFNAVGNVGVRSNGGDALRSDHPEYAPYAPVTPEAAQWQGWGTALKPACEPICMARKPLSEKTVAANVLRWGTAAINVDGCRVEGTWSRNTTTRSDIRGGAFVQGKSGGLECEPQSSHDLGRWPANVITDGSEEVVAGFPDNLKSGDLRGETVNADNQIYGKAGATLNRKLMVRDGDTGSAARFFYTAKADADERIGSKHPTVKPVDLMQYLVRMVTPPRGVVLDPFAGTGTTGEAAYREGMCATLIEREADYCIDIRRRFALVLAGPDERLRESIKASGKAQGHDDLPLFANESTE